MVGFMKSALNLLGIKKDGAASAEGMSLDDFLAALPEQMGFDITFTKKEDGERGLFYEVEGSEVDSFLGESSEMLDALSHVGMRVLRKSEGIANAPAAEGQEGPRLTFDSKGFRDRKAVELKEFASEQRQKVIDSGGKPAYIPALGPSERKIIHTHLSELGEVLSESIGRGNFKRIRVKLKEDSPHRRAPEPRAEGAEGAPAQRNAEGGGGNHGGGGRGRRGGRGRGGQQRGGRGGQGRRGGGGGGGFRNHEANGNEFRTESVGPHVDDNIGNRLRPGEKSLFAFDPKNSEFESDEAPTSFRGNKSGSDDNFGNR